jgi:nucleoside transporter
MKPTVFSKLSIMMLLEYFVWGAWYVTLGTYMKTVLHATDKEVGGAYGALAVATMFSPFFVGLVADRYFSAQRIMGVLHLLGAVLLYFAIKVTDVTTFYWIILLYSLLYTPTIALSNSIAFHQITDPGRQFPWIRVFGTVGWILSGLLIGYLALEASADKLSIAFQIAAGASALLGLLSFIMPHTPPRDKASNNSFLQTFVEALVLFKSKAYSIFFIAAILVCIPLSFYYGFANIFLNEVGMKGAAGKMILGQVSEAVFILAIPFLFYSIGVKRMLLLGMAAWILRYVMFAYGNVDANLWMLYAGIVLHGICYDFFFVTGYMYTEKKAGEKIKNAAQGLFTFATYGVGMFIGTWFSGVATDYYTVDGVHDWTRIWHVPAYIAAAVVLYFIFFFKEKDEIKQSS